MSRALRLGRGSKVDSFPVEKFWDAEILFEDAGTKLGMAGGGITYVPIAAADGSDAELGWRRIPIATQNTAYAFVNQDRGKCVQKTDATARSYTVNISIFNPGDEVTVVNNNATNNITIVQGTSVTLRLGGTTTTGNRTVAPWGRARIYCIAAGVFLVDGPGVT
jgi:hypothetical protein